MDLEFPKHRRYEVSFDGVSGPVLIEVPFDERAFDKELRESDVWTLVYTSARNVTLALDARRFLPGHSQKQPGNCYKIERVR